MSESEFDESVITSESELGARSSKSALCCLGL